MQTEAETEKNQGPGSELIGQLGSARVLFGLRAQGHIPTIECMLGEGKSWDEIGQAISWCPKTAKEHYERYER
jgi:hypothetical protein